MVEFLTKVHETNAIPTFVGIKFTSIDLNEGSACLRVGNGKFAVFLGADQIMAGAATLGFDSAIAATLNVLPEKAIKIFESFNKNDSVTINEARKNQEVITKFMECIVKHGKYKQFGVGVVVRVKACVLNSSVKTSLSDNRYIR